MRYFIIVKIATNLRSVPCIFYRYNYLYNFTILLYVYGEIPYVIKLLLLKIIGGLIAKRKNINCLIRLNYVQFVRIYSDIIIHYIYFI